MTHLKRIRKLIFCVIVFTAFTLGFMVRTFYIILDQPINSTGFHNWITLLVLIALEAAILAFEIWLYQSKRLGENNTKQEQLKEY